MMENGRETMCDTQNMKRIPIQKAKNLTKGNWIFVYGRGASRGNYEVDNFGSADDFYKLMVSACKRLNYVVEEPEWCEMPSEGDLEKFDKKM